MIGGCLSRLALVGLCGVAGYVAINADPNLPGQVVSAGAGGAEWLTGLLSHAGDATPHPTGLIPNPVPVIVHVTPASAPPTVSPTPSATPSPSSPTPMPTAPLPVTPALAPSPSATPSPTLWTLSSVWSRGDLEWALGTLRQDEADDTAAEQRFPASAAYYAGWASHWTEALEIIAALQYPQTEAPPVAYVDYVEPWYQEAIHLHQIDEQENPGNAWWDSAWVGYYSRLLTLWSLL